MNSIISTALVLLIAVAASAGEYPATVTQIQDGDTITCTIYVGFDIVLKDQRIRLRGINAPETRMNHRLPVTERLAAKQRGLDAKKWLTDQIVLAGNRVTLVTQEHEGRTEKGTFGRWLAVVLINGENVNQEMLRLGIAEKYEK